MLRGAKMEAWIIYSLIALVAFGANVIVYKLGFNGGVNPFVAAALYGLGIVIAAGITAAVTRADINVQPLNIAILIAAGAVFSIGLIMIGLGVSKNADVSKMAIIYGGNIIITVILGIVLLKENSGALWKTMLGMGLVAAGIIVVSVK